jgi:hypothetical protein
MNMNPRMLLFISLLILCFASVAGAATEVAEATAITSSSGAPSTLQIKQNFLAMQRDEINRNLRQVQRCITNAANPQILKDNEGNTRSVPKIDAITCAYQLKQLERELARLARSESRLSQDASVAAAVLERASRQAQLKKIKQALSGSSE